MMALLREVVFKRSWKQHITYHFTISINNCDEYSELSVL